jgi:hypothetical protein
MVATLDHFKDLWISRLPRTPVTSRIWDIWPEEWRKLSHMLAEFDIPEVHELGEMCFDLSDNSDSDDAHLHSYDSAAYPAQLPINYAQDTT